jgi:hypothetical protein
MAEQGTSPKQRGMTPLRAVLAAGGERPWDISGDYFHVSESAPNDLIVRFDDGEPVPVAAGLGFRRYYNKLTLESATGGAVLVFAGFGSVADARATANVNATVNVSPGNTFDDGGDVDVPDSAVTQLCAADPDRLYATVMVPSDAAGAIRVGTNAVGITSGQRIEPGMSVPVATTSALYAYHENGVTVTVSVSAVKEV